MTMFQALFFASLAVMATLTAVTSCPLPNDSCSSLPADSFSYDEILDNLPTSLYTLQVNASRTDLAFSPSAVQSQMTLSSLAEIRSGCSERNFNFGITNLGEVTCPFQFVCDYNPQRVPAHIFHARCSSSQLSDGTLCREVFYPVVTMTTESCDLLRDEGGWLVRTEMVASACVAVAAQ